MLSSVEQILFLLAVIISVFLSWKSFSKMFSVINLGQGKLITENFMRRAGQALSVFLSQKTVLASRPVASLIHAFLAWAFTLYFLVNVGDVLTGYISDFHFLGTGLIGDVYRLFVDIFSVLALISVAYFLIRRFVFNPPQLAIRENVLVMQDVRKGMRTDSLIVGLFIFFHVGFRFVGESVALAANPDAWQPLASAVSLLWVNMDSSTLTVFYHVCWWLALGLILAFIPYFPSSKHIHLFMGPLNYLTRPQRPAPGTLDRLDFEAEDAEQFGVAKLEQLDKTQLLDAYACIMCSRCQEVCPAYITGKELSPSALEINKRYFINRHKSDLLAGKEVDTAIVGQMISESALWACTSCAACVEICPVGNEPMFDILNIRRDKVLMESAFPKQLQTAFNGMERNSNPWNMNKDRMEWAAADPELKVPTVSENSDFDVLYWVGCAGAFEERGQGIARSFSKILNKAGVNFAVLGNQESCTGDSARRAGNEYLFSMMAEQNVETLKAAKVKKIVTTCPHCLHTLKNEYPQFGGNFEVIHHSQFIDQLISQGKINLRGKSADKITYHDPCYLGRHNQVFDEPRNVLSETAKNVLEMERNKNRSFCCGAGGGNMWKEEEEGQEAVRRNRFNEAASTGCSVIGTACPFCMTMLRDAGKELESGIEVRDIAEIVAENV